MKHQASSCSWFTSRYLAHLNIWQHFQSTAQLLGTQSLPRKMPRYTAPAGVSAEQSGTLAASRHSQAPAATRDPMAFLLGEGQLWQNQLYNH